MTEWYLNPVGGYWLVGGLALALLAVLVFLGVPAAQVSRSRRSVLFALRAAVLVMLMLVLLRPTLMATITKKQPATLVVLVDRSRSMQVADAVNGALRWQTLRQTLADAAEPLAGLEPDISVKGYAFDAEPSPLTISQGRFELEETPNGPETAIGAALEEMLRREAGQRLVGVALLSDGAQRASRRATRRRRRWSGGWPIWAIRCMRFPSGKPVAPGKSRCGGERLARQSDGVCQERADRQRHAARSTVSPIKSCRCGCCSRALAERWKLSRPWRLTLKPAPGAADRIELCAHDARRI